jgi:hypothetical protein
MPPKSKKMNVSLAMVDHRYWNHGLMIAVRTSDGSHRDGQITGFPM